MTRLVATTTRSVEMAFPSEQRKEEKLRARTAWEMTVKQQLLCLPPEYCIALYLGLVHQNASWEFFVATLGALKWPKYITPNAINSITMLLCSKKNQGTHCLILIFFLTGVFRTWRLLRSNIVKRHIDTLKGAHQAPFTVCSVAPWFWDTDALFAEVITSTIRHRASVAPPAVAAAQRLPHR